MKTTATDDKSKFEKIDHLIQVSKNPALLRLSKSKSVLFLQGPVGPMFTKLGNWLQKNGTKVHKVVFNGGDVWDARSLYKNHLTLFTLRMMSWPKTFRSLCFSHAVDIVVLFGQSRPCHVPIFDIAKEIGVEVLVFEEGYFRPGFATLELKGVNGNSETMKRYFWQQSCIDNQLLMPELTNWYFLKTSCHAALYYLNLFIFRKRFPWYQHHRETSLFFYTKFWLRSVFVKLLKQKGDYEILRSLFIRNKGIFFIPLQVDEDPQLILHGCNFKNTEFIQHVLGSFAKYGHLDDVLLIKQHPMTRGRVGYEKFIKDVSSRLGLGQRVICVWEGDISLILKACIGVLSINSTLGLKALEFGKPVKVMGHAVYDTSGVTSQQALKEFWVKPQKPDPRKARVFLDQLKHLTQIPCSIYANADETWLFLQTQ